MAPPTKKTAAAQPARKVASLNPEDMVAGGLPSDFDGEITQADFRPYNYPKADGTAMDHYVLTLYLYIEPDAASGFDPFDVYISAGSLDNHVPSKDGQTPVPIHEVDEPGEECVGYFAVQVGKKETLGKDTKLGHWMRALMDAGFDMAALADGDVRGLIGLYGHFDLIEYKSKGGDRGGVSTEKKRNDLLVVTEIKSKPKAAKAMAGKATAVSTAKPAAKKVTAAEPEEAEETDAEAEDGSALADRVSEVIVEMIAENDGSLLETKVAPKLMLALKAEGTSSEAIALIRANNGAFLRESELWSYDPATKTLSL